MIRASLAMAVLSAAMFAPAHGQVAQPRAQLQGDGVETNRCAIEAIAFTRNGVGFVCNAGGSGRMLIASDGGTRPGGVAALTSWMMDARDARTTARDGATVRHQAPSPAVQGICDDLAMPGPTNRAPMQCRELVAAHH